MVTVEVGQGDDAALAGAGRQRRSSITTLHTMPPQADIAGSRRPCQPPRLRPPARRGCASQVARDDAPFARRLTAPRLLRSRGDPRLLTRWRGAAGPRRGARHRRLLQPSARRAGPGRSRHRPAARRRPGRGRHQLLGADPDAAVLHGAELPAGGAAADDRASRASSSCWACCARRSARRPRRRTRWWSACSLFLTFFVMGPTFDQVYTEAYQPYAENRIAFEEALRARRGAAARLHAEADARSPT